MVKAGALCVVLLAGCGPRVAVGGDNDETSDSASPESTNAVMSSSGAASLESEGSVDASTGGLDEGPFGSSGGDPSGGDLPDPPQLPPACPGDRLRGDVLSPQEVYIAGTLSEGACYRDALAHWSTANDAVAGFDCYFDNRTAAIRPTDGRLLYVNTFEGVLREFRCDVCPIAGNDAYPDDPLANDVNVPTPMCENESSLRFLVSPDGSHLFRCTGDWIHSEGIPISNPSEGELLHLGYDGLALTEVDVLNLTTGALAPWAGPFDDAPIAIRADPRDGFLVVRPFDEPRLLHVSSAGRVSDLGAYPAPPDGYAPSVGAALDGCGALLQLAYGPETFEDAVIRRDLDGASDVVYSESYDPVVKLHISALVTAP